MVPSVASPAIRAASTVVRPDAVKVHLAADIPSNRVAPRNTLPELKSKGYLNGDFDGFIYADSTFTYEGADTVFKTGEFKTDEDLLLLLGLGQRAR